MAVKVGSDQTRRDEYWDVNVEMDLNALLLCLDPSLHVHSLAPLCDTDVVSVPGVCVCGGGLIEVRCTAASELILEFRLLFLHQAASTPA